MTSKRIYNPVTKTYYSIRPRSEIKPENETILGHWKPNAVDYKAEWYLKKNAELVKALLRIKKILDKLDLKDIDLTVENLLKIQNIIEKQNLESGYRTVDDKDGTVIK